LQDFSFGFITRHPEGTLTKCPYSSNIAGRATFSKQYFCFPINQSATHSHNIRSGIISPC
jgi:hypothetical protein